MTKTDLIAQVAANTEMSKKSAEQAVSCKSGCLDSHSSRKCSIIDLTTPHRNEAEHSPAEDTNGSVSRKTGGIKSTESIESWICLCGG